MRYLPDTHTALRALDKPNIVSLAIAENLTVLSANKNIQKYDIKYIGQ